MCTILSMIECLHEQKYDGRKGSILSLFSSFLICAPQSSVISKSHIYSSSLNSSKLLILRRP